MQAKGLTPQATRVERKCAKCGGPIAECMGFVLAGDFLQMVGGKRKREHVREICGKCALPLLFLDIPAIATFVASLKALTGHCIEKEDA